MSAFANSGQIRESQISCIPGLPSNCDRTPFGKGSKVHFSTDHLTDEGVEFAKWLFTDRIEALRCRE
jgi:hypothetical protein